MFARNHLESIKICAAEMIKPFLQNLQERSGEPIRTWVKPQFVVKRLAKILSTLKLYK